MVEPSYKPAPKSGCSGVVAPMKLIIAFELGSTEALEIFWFPRVVCREGNETVQTCAPAKAHAAAGALSKEW